MADRTIPHNALVTLVRDYLAVQGACVVKLHGGAYQEPGLPDLMVVKDGRSVFVEVKTGKAELNVHQRRMRERLVAAGALFIESRCLGDVIEAMCGAGFDLVGTVN